MFGFLSDMAKGVGQVIGVGVGSILGVSSVLIANTLGITVDMVEQAREAGCETYEEIRDFFED